MLNASHFFDTHADCGALGVKMTDGSGNFFEGIETIISITSYLFVQIVRFIERISKIKIVWPVSFRTS